MSFRSVGRRTDLFTKSLDVATTLKHMAALGLVECMSDASVVVSQSVVATSLRDAAVGGRPLSLVERYKLSEKRRWLLIEFCAPHDSTMSLLGQKDEDVTVLTVSEEDDGTDPDTLKLLKQVCAMHVLAGKKVFLWSSTPSTQEAVHFSISIFIATRRNTERNILTTCGPSTESCGRLLSSSPSTYMDGRLNGLFAQLTGHGARRSIL